MTQKSKNKKRTSEHKQQLLKHKIRYGNAFEVLISAIINVLQFKEETSMMNSEKWKFKRPPNVSCYIYATYIFANLYSNPHISLGWNFWSSKNSNSWSSYHEIYIDSLIQTSISFLHTRGWFYVLPMRLNRASKVRTLEM